MRRESCNNCSLLRNHTGSTGHVCSRALPLLPAKPTRVECLPSPDEAAGGPPAVSVEGRADQPARPTSPS
eukprot:1378486-Alexandrium_andersonii.AAC.1